MAEQQKIENVIIVGSGPAGYTAALYTSRANLRPLVIEGFAWGGLLQQTTDVENYPGYRDGVMGPEMMQEFRDQAERFGTRFVTDDVTRVGAGARAGRRARVWVGRRGAPRAHRDPGHGRRAPQARASPARRSWAAAACPTARPATPPSSRTATTVIVGGGDSAMEEAIFLAKFASKVTVVHRRDEFRASKIMLERARAMPTTSSGSRPTSSRSWWPARTARWAPPACATPRPARSASCRRPAAFIAIGHEPQSELVDGQIDTDENGYVVTEGKSTRTEPARRVRRRRPRRPHLPPGGHRRRQRLSGSAGRRVVPARQPAGRQAAPSWPTCSACRRLCGRWREPASSRPAAPGPSAARPAPRISSVDSAGSAAPTRRGGQAPRAGRRESRAGPSTTDSPARSASPRARPRTPRSGPGRGRPGCWVTAASSTTSADGQGIDPGRDAHRQQPTPARSSRRDA